MNKYKLINWSKNRPVDNVRAQDITKYYQEHSIKFIPGIIYVWFKNEKYYILDGLHRYSGALNMSINMKLILHINYSTNENEIIDEFINLNKSISIPSIYLEDNNRKKNMCESIVNKLILKYPNFVSPSRKHFLYNFNRDLLIEYFSTFNMDYTMPDIDCKIFNKKRGCLKSPRQPLFIQTSDGEIFCTARAQNLPVTFETAYFLFIKIIFYYIP